MRPVVKWSGSKRSQADAILKEFPESFGDYYEPFIGGGSILYHVCKNGLAKKRFASDICVPLVRLWEIIRDDPSSLVDDYAVRWKEFQKDMGGYYYAMRDEFNRMFSPYILMFLSRTCANGLIRFNGQGKFNSPVHWTRPGMNPDTLREIVSEWSDLIRNVEFSVRDYGDILRTVKKGDLVYLDPPYFHTRGIYYGSIGFDRFVSFLEELNGRGVFWLLSYDGRRGDDDQCVEMPETLYRKHSLLYSGKSSINNLMNGKDVPVYESLYRNF